jgi:hypothetical protein
MGIHVSINLKFLGLGSRAFGICHGETGKWIMEMWGDPQSMMGLKQSHN